MNRCTQFTSRTQVRDLRKWVTDPIYTSLRKSFRAVREYAAARLVYKCVRKYTVLDLCTSLVHALGAREYTAARLVYKCKRWAYASTQLLGESKSCVRAHV